MDDLRKAIIDHEDNKLFPYTDTKGKLTIGVGHNLTDRGISNKISMLMMEDDLAECYSQLQNFPWYTQMDKVRSEVIVELCFNIGITKLLKFTKMIAAITKHDWVNATNELLDSKWRTDVGAIRSNNMAKRLLKGSY